MKQAIGMAFLLVFGLVGQSYTQSQTSNESKKKAAGIYYLCDESEGSILGLISHFQNTSVEGVSYRTAWEDMQSTESTLTWKKADSMMEAARVYGKPMGLNIVAGFRSPSWLKNSGVAMMDVTLVRSFAPPTKVSMPIPWDPVYLEKWGQFLKSVGDRYDGNSSLSYVTMAGMGHAFEPFMAKTNEDIQNFNKLGGLPKWIEGSKKIIDLYAAAFPTTPFILAMSYPVPDRRVAEPAINEVVSYGLAKYPGRFGVMYHGLDAKADLSNGFHNIIYQQQTKTTVGYQMVWSTTGTNASWLKGSLAQCLDAGARMGGHFVEVYGSDCDNSRYTSTLLQASPKLKANIPNYSEPEYSLGN